MEPGGRSCYGDRFIKNMTEQMHDFLGSELLSPWNDGQKLLASVTGGFSDYSFVVFPFAKVYEGFLKKLFLQIGAINEHQYNNERWRVGRALNPQLEKEFRHVESVYDRLAENCNPQLSEMLWEAWKHGRNQVFHYWPGRTKPLSFEAAREIITELELAMEKALAQCEL